MSPRRVRCAATGRPAEAVTAWAALAALIHFDWPAEARRRKEPLRAARQALGPDQTRAAEQRGASTSLATAAEYALMLTEDTGPRRALHISVRTVSSHLDRIRTRPAPAAAPT